MMWKKLSGYIHAVNNCDSFLNHRISQWEKRDTPNWFYLVLQSWPFSAGCPLNGHTYLNKPAAQSCGFV